MKNLSVRCAILLSACGALAGVAAAQPANDSCANAITITPGSDTPGTNVNATSDVSSTSCAFDPTDDLDVWYKFTPAVSADYFFDLSTSIDLADSTLAIFSGCGGTELFCDDDSGLATLSSLRAPLNAGTTYYIRVAGWDHEQGGFNLIVSAPITTGGADNCSGATVATAPAAFAGNTSTFTSELGASSCSNLDSVDAWFSLTPSVSGFYRFSTNGSTSLDDTSLSIFAGCGGTELFCDDDAGADFLSELTVSLNAGTNYLIRVAGYEGAVGQFLLTIGSPVVVAAPPANDTCANAAVIPGLPYQSIVDISGATADLDIASCNDSDATSIPQAVWYRYTPATSTRVRMVENSVYNTFFAVFTSTNGCNGPFTELPDTCDFNITFNVTAGTTYYILVGAFPPAPLPPTVEINLTLEEVVAPANDLCSNATVVSGTLSGSFNNANAGLENGPPGSCNDTTAPGIDNSVWYTFTPGSNGTLAGSIDSPVDDYDIVAVLFTGTCGSLTEVACWDEPQPMNLATPGSGSSALTAGTRYYLAIGDWGTFDGGGNTVFTITVPGGAVNGACCSGSTCSATSAAACTGANTSFSGTGTTCNAFGVNNTAPCCLADYNHVGGVTVQDIFDFLAGYFSGSNQANINGGTVTVQDIFDFLAAYFGGCV